MKPGAAWVGVDIGGTFTDVIAVDGDRIEITKVLTTPKDLSQGVVDGVAAVLAQLDLKASDVASVVHATTVATNALLERRGGRVGLMVTEGFGDILEIARQRRPDPYDLFAHKLEPLIPRDRVIEIPERVGADGCSLTAMDEDAVRDGWLRLERAGVDAIAIVFLHSYANPSHELRAGEIVAGLVPAGTPVFLSHEVLPEPREYERASTTVIAAYLGQVTSGYQQVLSQRLAQMGAPGRFWVMKSSGGLVTSDRAAAHPEELVESGPAAGVIAAAGTAKRLGLGGVLSFDMGGTTAKASLVLDGTPPLTWDYEVGGPAHVGGFLQRGSGHPLRVPVIDLAEVGTGGGSIAWIDEAGALRVGPQSAGADPGPACYGRGGVRPTVTDADVVLGYLDVGGGKSELGRLDAGAAGASIRQAVAEPLGISVEDAAAGIFKLANAQMAGALRLVSMARGYDPRDFALLAFGGAGPVHAWAVADELGITQLVVPPFAGVNSAVGLLQADFRVDLSRAHRTRLSDGQRAAAIPGILARLAAEAVAGLTEQGYDPDQISTSYSADMRYVGQSYDVSVPFPAEHSDLGGLGQAFHREHERVYAHAHPDEDVEVTTLRLSATAPGLGFAFRPRVDGTSGLGENEGRRPVRFGDRTHEARTLRRASIGERTINGPAAIEDTDTTVLVPPHGRATVDEAGFVSVRLAPEVDHG